jgi:hypothetical protein
MSEKDSFNLYLETSTVKNAKELDDFDSFSECVETLVSAYLSGEIDIDEYEVPTGDHTGAHSSELDSLEERMDEFEERAQVAFDGRDDRLDSLREDVEDLRDRVSSLENVAQK